MKIVLISGALFVALYLYSLNTKLTIPTVVPCVENMDNNHSTELWGEF